EASIGSVIRVVDAAKPPATPARRRLLGLVFGGIFGLVLGVGGAFIKEQAEDPIKSAEHGERVLSLRVLAAIPEISPELAGTPGAGPGLRAPSLWESLRAGRWSSAGFLETARHRRSVFAESFRRLRTNLLYLRKQPPRTLLVTSPGSDEGTEIVAANLAVALAHAGLRVWLVECDLMNPALDRAPPLQSACGRGARRHIEAVGAQVLGVVLTGATIAGPGTRPGRSDRHDGVEESPAWFFGPGRHPSAETGASPAPESPETGASTAPMSVRGGARLPLLTGTLATLLAAGAGITVGLLLR